MGLVGMSSASFFSMLKQLSCIQELNLWPIVLNEVSHRFAATKILCQRTKDRADAKGAVVNL